MKAPWFVLHCGECNHQLHRHREGSLAECSNRYCPQQGQTFDPSKPHKIGGPFLPKTEAA